MNCQVHGEVETHPDEHGSVYCPKCMCEAVQEVMGDGGRVYVDRLGYPVLVVPYVPLQVSKIQLQLDPPSVGFATEPVPAMEPEVPCPPMPVEVVKPKTVKLPSSAPLFHRGFEARKSPMPVPGKDEE